MPPEALRAAARQLAEIVLTAHRRYLEEFQQITARARITFENRAWTQGSLDAERVTEPRRVSKRFPAPNKHRDFQPSPLNAPLFRPASVVNR